MAPPERSHALYSYVLIGLELLIDRVCALSWENVKGIGMAVSVVVCKWCVY